MLQIKPGVDLSNLSPQMGIAAQVVRDVYREIFKSDCVITSGRDGKHLTVIHYLGQALDFRVNNLAPADRGRVKGEVKRALGGERSQYDVVLKEHAESPCLHVEFDPR